MSEEIKYSLSALTLIGLALVISGGAFTIYSLKQQVKMYQAQEIARQP